MSSRQQRIIRGERPFVASRKRTGREFWSDEEPEELDANNRKLKGIPGSDTFFGSTRANPNKKGFAYWMVQVQWIVYATVFVYAGATLNEMYKNDGTTPRRGVWQIPSSSSKEMNSRKEQQ